MQHQHSDHAVGQRSCAVKHLLGQLQLSFLLSYTSLFSTSPYIYNSAMLASFLAVSTSLAIAQALSIRDMSGTFDRVTAHTSVRLVYCIFTSRSDLRSCSTLPASEFLAAKRTSIASLTFREHLHAVRLSSFALSIQLNLF